MTITVHYLVGLGLTIAAILLLFANQPVWAVLVSGCGVITFGGLLRRML